MKRRFNNKALTLIEILIAMGIASVVGVFLLVVIVNSAGLFSRQLPKVQGGLNVNDALAVFRSSIKQATSIIQSYSDGTTTYTTGSNQLVLQAFSIDSANKIISDTYDVFIFYSDQGILHFRIFPNILSDRKNTDQVLSSSTDNLLFSYFNNDNPPVEVVPTSATKVRFTLTLKQKAGLGFETHVATSEANLRND